MKKKIPIVIKKRHFYVLDPIFKQRIHVFLNYSGADFRKWCKSIGAEYDTDRYNEQDDATFAGFSTYMTLEGKPPQWIIVQKDFNWSIHSQETLIHEIVHTVIKIWRSNNIPYNDDTQEFLAHEIANIYGDIAHKLLV